MFSCRASAAKGHPTMCRYDSRFRNFAAPPTVSWRAGRRLTTRQYLNSAEFASRAAPAPLNAYGGVKEHKGTPLDTKSGVARFRFVYGRGAGKIGGRRRRSACSRGTGRGYGR